MNAYFPCKLVEHQKGFSIICSDFHYFDNYFGDKGCGGYTIEKLAKKLVKEHKIQKEVSFDSEAGMFCAYSQAKEGLLKLALLLSEITGGEENYTAPTDVNPKIPFEEAEKLLLNGFVIRLDDQAQNDFYKNVPYPRLTNKQSEYLDFLKSGTNEEKVLASKRINSEARTKTRKWDNFLSHPKTITVFLEAIEVETDNKVLQELIWAIAFICDRHLPDLRTKPYFEKALGNKNATIRWLGLLGLGNLFENSEDLILTMTNDKSEKVRKEAERQIKFARGKTQEFPVWMFNEKNYK